jgi:hypothetical protein
MAKTTSKKGTAKPRRAGKPKLLSGDNPQIAKAEGDAPVQAYIAAIPGFYGVADQTWFLSYHCFTSYVKVTFFRGTSLKPMPPGASKHPEVRYLDLRENDDIDDGRLERWVKQASKLPGEKL